MRKILSRGKKPDGKWIQGYRIKKDLIISANAKIEIAQEWYYVSDIDIVIPETVGQLWFTKEDGTPIFEGDILQFENKEEKELYAVRYNKTFKCLALLYCINTETQIITISKKKWTFLTELSSVEEFFNHTKVVGNVVDNPEIVGELTIKIEKNKEVL